MNEHQSLARFTWVVVIIGAILYVWFWLTTPSLAFFGATPISTNDTRDRDQLARQIYAQTVTRPMPNGQQPDTYYKRLAKEAVEMADEFEKYLKDSRDKK